MKQTEIRRLSASIARRRQQARNQLEKLARVDNGNAQSFGYFPNRGPSNGLISQPRATAPGEFNVMYGKMPTDDDVSRFIQATGGDPNVRKLAASLKKRARAAVAPPRTPPQAAPGSPQWYGQQAMGGGAPAIDPNSPAGLLQQYATMQRDAEERARQENLKRYDEGHGELTDVRNRNQDRVGNWGIAASQDIDERMQESLSAAKANAAERGLGNANITDAYRLRAARDTAREQQRVSEMRDSRASEYDTRDTGNLVGFVERRNDTASDPSIMANLALQLGQNAQGVEAEKARSRADMLQRELARRQNQQYRPPTYPSGRNQGPVFLNPGQMGFPTLGMPMMGMPMSRTAMVAPRQAPRIMPEQRQALLETAQLKKLMRKKNAKLPQQRILSAPPIPRTMQPLGGLQPRLYA